ncbi:recombination regulator RecX [Legionella fallonii]|uniref:Regulatory protein RecX n=1 Tax=Legionella fallonii LLAP-10 TaxID=1212491 RepID=A0A098G5T4_9GAMM|nr:recombination regulator RecX [Legionella fallonii]CEG57334.1 Regulatory protein RecX [Legionella fallonii LLAP-10]
MTEAFESALRLLTRREHGALELCDKLEQKGFSQKEAKNALEACQRLGLQSDSRFVENYTNSRLRQGYGPLKISQELKIKGLDKELILEKLEQEKDNWLAHAVKVWEKKSRGKKDLSFDEMQKLQTFLLYRGFTMDIIAQVVKTLK